MIRDQIEKDIQKVISKFQNPNSNQEIELRRSENPKFGDFSTNVALRVTNVTKVSNESKDEKNKAVFKQSPMEIANILADSLKNQPYIEKLQAVNPGFVNFFIKDSVWQGQVKEVLELQSRFGSNKTGKAKKARVEFVSANPTGPLHFGNARGGPSGDVLASVLQFSGYEVLREYYNNDVGGQIAKLGESILNVAAREPLEEQEYKGLYINELVKKITPRVILGSETTPESIPSKDSGQARMTMRAGVEAVKILSEENIADCEAMGIRFDKVFSESEFIKSGKTEEAIKFLEEKGVLKKKDGARWFVPNDEFLKDRETVVVKSDGSFTYFANDIAYHRLKFDENYDLVVDVMGANHHGHVPRLNAAISALGFEVSKFKVILYQWVRFRKHGKPYTMSKRAGSFITAREVIEEIGKDALRFMLLTYDTNSPIEFDIDLAREQSAKNPVYYVQYAHARISSILAKSEIRNPKSETNYELLSTNYELNLIKQISRFPELVEDISNNFEVHHLTKYAIELADCFHKFYENCRVIGEEKELMEARTALVEATRITLGNTLRLLGVNAPEKM